VLADASAFLWRLQLRNIDVHGRWQLLADRWETRTLAGARPFYVVHAMMAFAAAGRSIAAARVFEALPPVDTSDVSMSVPEEALAPPFCEALLAFAHSDPACVEPTSRSWPFRTSFISSIAATTSAQICCATGSSVDLTARQPTGLNGGPPVDSITGQLFRGHPLSDALGDTVANGLVDIAPILEGSRQHRFAHSLLQVTDDV
jgi:hypothetical protein